MLGFPSFLHFGENTTANRSNMLTTVRSAVQYIHLHTEFKTFYASQENVAISQTKMKWQLSYVQFNPSKCMKICNWQESTREIQNGKFIYFFTLQQAHKVTCVCNNPRYPPCTFITSVQFPDFSANNVLSFVYSQVWTVS